MSSTDLSPDELTVLELRTPSLTPEQKSTGLLARSRVQDGTQNKGTCPEDNKHPNETSAWKNRTLRVLTVFSGQELAPWVEEGAAFLEGSMSVQVKAVDVSTWLLDNHQNSCCTACNSKAMTRFLSLFLR